MVTPKRRWKDILLGHFNPSQPWTQEEPLPTEPLIIDNERQLAYLSLDLELNLHWSNLINRLVIAIEEGKERINEPIIIDGDRLMAFRGSFDEDKYINNLAMGPHDSQHFLHNMLGLSTANLRDPIYRSLLFRLNEMLKSYEHQDLTKVEDAMVSPKILNINVSRLVTYEEKVDIDLINLIDQQLLQSHQNNLQFLRRHLVARQRRLNHDPFSISLDILAPVDMTLQTRMYLTLPNQLGTRLHLDSFKCSLKKGINQFERLFPSANTEPTLSELYEVDSPLTDGTSSSRFPPHLLLPRGTRDGLKLQLLVELTAWTGSELEFDGVSVPVLAETLKDVIIFHHQA